MPARRVLAVLACLGAIVSAPATIRAQLPGSTDEAARLRAFREYDAARREFLSERWDEAEARLQRVVRMEPLFVAAHYLLGRTHMQQERYRSAVQSYLAAERAAVVLGARARSASLRPGRDERLLAVEGARGVTPSQYAFPAELPLALGSAYHRLGDLEQAEREYLTAIEINRQLGEAHNNLAVLYFAEGRVDAARSEAKLAEKAGFRVHPRFMEDLSAAR